jgi:hypothetical protein
VVRSGVPSKRARVAFLLVVLAVSAAWAYGRVSARRARTTWDRPVDVLVFAIGEAEPGTIDALAATLDALAARLAEDRARYGSGPEPFRFTVVGPILVERLPPADPPGTALLARARHALELWRAGRAVEEAALALDPALPLDAFDVQVHLLLVSGEAVGAFAEGIGELGGEVAVVRAGIDGGALLAATAVVHETLHTLGATDKYDPRGHAIPPAGLYEPERSPALPQLRAEIMVGELALGTGRGRLPDGVEELGVGPVTAAEIGWVPADAAPH